MNYKWWKEIKAVGLKDWLWFVLVINRNEFSRNLNIEIEVTKLRDKAHRIDSILEDIK